MACFAPVHAWRVGGGVSLRMPQQDAPYIALPCGKCVGCRRERARQWAIRLDHEGRLHDAASFLTLTYAKKLPADTKAWKRDAQLFLKRLRKTLDQKIRYYMVGELGSKNGRPHIHAIVFGYWPDDLQPIRKGKTPLYRSSSLEKIWPHGYSSVGRVSFESVAYVAQYTLDKTGEKSSKTYREWSLMSRRPGIGAGWKKKFASDVYPSDEVVIRGHAGRPPRYYDRLLEKSDPILYEIVRLRRQISIEKSDEKNLDRYDFRRLQAKEKIAVAKMKRREKKL